jgi:hypothetical protein
MIVPWVTSEYSYLHKSQFFNLSSLLLSKSVSVSVYFSMHSLIHPSIHPYVCLSICLSLCLSTWPSVCLNYMSVCPSLSIYVPTCLSIRLSIYPSNCRSLILFICLCVCVCVCLWMPVTCIFSVITHIMSHESRLKLEKYKNVYF